MRAKIVNFGERTVDVGNFLQGINAYFDESALSASVAKDCYNFDFNTCVLSDGYGLELVNAFKNYNVSKVWVYKRFNYDSNAFENIFMCLKDNQVHYLDNNNLIPLNVFFNSHLTTVNYRLYGKDVIIMCGEKEGMIVWDKISAPYKVEDAPFITSLCVHKERLFVTISGQKNAVWFSSDLDPTNWEINLNAGGFIEMPDDGGLVNKVLSFLGYVYIFKSNGISRLSANGSQENFYLSNLFVSAGGIISDTITTCGDRIIFLSSEGLYCFDGVNTYLILPQIAPLLSGKNSCACFNNGKYYLSFTFAKGENQGRGGLLVYDVKSKRYSISVMDISSFCVFDSVWAIYQNSVYNVTKNGKIGNSISLKKWCVPKIDWGNSADKVIKAVDIFTKKDIVLIFRNDFEEKQVIIRGKNTLQRRKLFFSGKRIGVDIVSKQCDNQISNFSLIFDRR